MTAPDSAAASSTLPEAHYVRPSRRLQLHPWRV